jgi:hypothetical protein
VLLRVAVRTDDDDDNDDNDDDDDGGGGGSGSGGDDDGHGDGRGGGGGQGGGDNDYSSTKLTKTMCCRGGTSLFRSTSEYNLFFSGAKPHKLGSRGRGMRTPPLSIMVVEWSGVALWC